MTPNDAARLLAIAAAYDNRKPDATSAQAWALALDGYRAEDCQQAIVAHYQTSTEWIMPAHVIAAVKKARASRIEDAPPIPIPNGFDPDDTAAYQRILAESRRAQAEGREVVMPHYPATRRFAELRAELHKVPAIEAKPPTRTAEHQAALEAARAELASVPVAHPDAQAAEGEEVAG